MLKGTKTTDPYLAGVATGADTKHTSALTRARASAAGPGQLARAEGKINAVKYREILSTMLKNRRRVNIV